ncbi:hypothetical protein [Curtobacterium herbarum]|uniref:Uncharacterized protein n=1 Tax=Curtobacterium herbarum TaxID=150122 RepID=A0ABP4K6A2_9MICO|nr:hypothetical protein [Curtobacterium herbarum]MBM7474570.1 hypothetical protein [Curtobacterium herbarum]MCS6545950.1 hypothetical protein [Curtobacterium herbarum]
MSAWVKLSTTTGPQMVNLDRFDQVWVEKAGLPSDDYELHVRSAEAGTKRFFFAPADATDEQLAQRWRLLAGVAGIPSFGQAPLFPKQATDR